MPDYRLSNATMQMPHRRTPVPEEQLDDRLSNGVVGIGVELPHRLNGQRNWLGFRTCDMADAKSLPSHAPGTLVAM